MGQFSAPACANQPSGFSVRGASTDCEWFNVFSVTILCLPRRLRKQKIVMLKKC